MTTSFATPKETSNWQTLVTPPSWPQRGRLGRAVWARCAGWPLSWSSDRNAMTARLTSGPLVSSHTRWPMETLPISKRVSIRLSWISLSCKRHRSKASGALSSRGLCPTAWPRTQIRGQVPPSCSSTNSFRGQRTIKRNSPKLSNSTSQSNSNAGLKAKRLKNEVLLCSTFNLLEKTSLANKSEIKSNLRHQNNKLTYGVLGFWGFGVLGFRV